ncbi:MAG: YgfZ/GcvT domain-containing protein [Phycisphaerales bacterium]
MARVSPLRAMHDNAGAAAAPWGPAEADVLVPQAFAELELEYAAIRKTAALFDQPQRGTLVITGADRFAFLNRMVTQELKGFDTPFQCRRTFWLNRKGRIDADLRLIETGDGTIADVDVFAAERARAGLAAFMITEDVAIEDASETYHRLALHGPLAPRIIEAISRVKAGPAVGDLLPGGACVTEIAGCEVIVDRWDALGEIGLELLVRRADAENACRELLAFAHEHEGHASPTGSPRPELRLRPAGWRAYNIARIEAGTPIYNIDFGPDSLPHETGVHRDRVSFTKGCYLGQEVVARMESRGHSKRTLVGVRCGPPAAPEGGAGTPFDRPMPVSGSPIFASDAPDAEAVGVVTSATLSPMLGAAAIGFAAVKPAQAAAGTTVFVEAEGERVRARVQPSLASYARTAG